MTLRWPGVLASIAMATEVLGCTSAVAGASRSPNTPPWVAIPSGADFAQTYPHGDQRQDSDGAAAIRCRIAASGAVVGCVVLEEIPDHEGFGQAALALARGFRMDTHTLDPRWSTGAIISIPIRFTVENDPAAPSLKVMPGSASMLVTFVKSAPQKHGRLFDCPSPADPQRRCQSHLVRWIDPPSIDAETSLFAAVDLATGASLLECKPTPDGALAGCKLSGDTTPKTEAAVMELAKLFRAEPKAEDGTPISDGRILIEFDWAALQQLNRQPLP